MENSENITPQENKKMAAGLLAIFLGSLGAHKFYLGYTSQGIILLLSTILIIPIFTLITCGIGSFLWPVVFIVPVIEGILYLIKTDEEFYETYQRNKKEWF